MIVPALSFRDVRKEFTPKGRAPIEALSGFELDVQRGEFIVFLGPSGCGKSTLLYMVAGLEPTSGGQILEEGRPIEGPSSERGLIFQDASLFPWLSIADNVAFGLSLRGVSPVQQKETTERLLRSVGLGGMGDKRPDELSGGMRQRAACARALAMRPRVLMMDEPFAALDVQTRNKMQDFLLNLWRESGASIILVTHSIDEAISLADRVVVFTARPGRVKTIVPIEMERPRPSRDPRYHRYRDMFTDLLADEVDRAFAEQQGPAA